MDIAHHLVSYMLRAGLGRQLQLLCDELLRRRGFEASLVFWRAFAYAREGNLAAAIRDTETLRGRRECDYAALAALSVYYRCSKTDDARDSLALVETALRSAVGTASGQALLLAAHFRWLTGSSDAARATLDRVLAGNPSHEGALTLQGWLRVTDGQFPHGGPGWGLLHKPPALLTEDAAAAVRAPSAAAGRSGSNTSNSLSSAAVAEVESLNVAIAAFHGILGPAYAGLGQPNLPSSRQTPSSSPQQSRGVNVDAAVGLARAYIRRGEPATAVALLSQAAGELGASAAASSGNDEAESGGAGGGAGSRDGEMVTALTAVLMVERASALLRCGEWDLALDTGLLPVLASDPSHIPALALSLCLSQLREGPGSISALTRLQQLAAAVGRQEPRTGGLIHYLAQQAARLCLRCRPALAVTLTLARTAVAADPECSAFCGELGLQCLAAGDLPGALSAFHDAASLDEGNAGAVVGTIAAQVTRGELGDAGAQLDMFRMVSESVGRPPLLALLDAQMSWRAGRDRGAHRGFLDEATRLHLRASGLDGPALTSGGAWGEGAGGAHGGVGSGGGSGSMEYTGLAASRYSSAAEPASPVPTALISSLDAEEPGLWGGALGGNAPLSAARPFLLRLPPPSAGDVPEWYAACDPLLLLDCAREYLQRVEGSGGAYFPPSHSPSHAAAADRASGGSGIGGPAASSADAAGPGGGVLGFVPHADACDSSSPAFTRGVALTELVASLMPACVPAWMLMAQAHANACNWEAAARAAANALSTEPGCIEAALLAAHVALARGQHSAAATCLESALSQSFGVQSLPAFHRLRAGCAAAEGRWEAALGSLLSAASLLSGGPSGGGASNGNMPLSKRGAALVAALVGGGGGNTPASTVHSQAASLERLALCLAAAGVLGALELWGEAGEVLRAAASEYAGDPESLARLALASARQALGVADFDAALKALRTIPDTSPQYLSGVRLRADLALTHLRDRSAYVACYEELAARAGPRREEALITLGDACMTVQLADAAVAAYEKALRISVSRGSYNGPLARRLGSTLVRMHDYGRAVSFYSEALAPGAARLPPLDKASLRSDLASLLLRLGRLEDAEALLGEAEGTLGAAAASRRAGGPAPPVPDAPDVTASGGIRVSRGSGSAGQLPLDTEFQMLRLLRGNLSQLAQVLRRRGAALAGQSLMGTATSPVQAVRAVAPSAPASNAQSPHSEEDEGQEWARAAAAAAAAAGALRRALEVQRSIISLARELSTVAPQVAALLAQQRDTAPSGAGAQGGVAQLTSVAGRGGPSSSPTVTPRSADDATALSTNRSSPRYQPPSPTPAPMAPLSLLAVEHNEAALLCIALGDVARDSPAGASPSATASASTEGGAAPGAIPTSSGPSSAAAEHYTEALRYVEAHEGALMALAQLYQSRGDAQACRQVCTALTTAYPGHTGARLMLADLLFAANDAPAAIHHYGALLEASPRDYTVLSRLISLLKRCGRLVEAEAFLRSAVAGASNTPRPAAAQLASHLSAQGALEATDPGFRFCRGLLARYNNQPHDAIAAFNAVRHNAAWAARAVEHMAEIYLSPDNEPLWTLHTHADAADFEAEADGAEDRGPGEEEGDSSLDGSTGAASGGGRNIASDVRRARQTHGVSVAQRLLAELPEGLRTPRHGVLYVHSLIADGGKSALAEAKRLTRAALSRDPADPAHLLCSAMISMVCGDVAEARATAKKLLRLPAAVGPGLDDWVKGWLLLSDTFIDAGKHEQATEALQRAIALDASSSRAFECLGAIAERENRVAEAAAHYEAAWRHESMGNAAVGYKLAMAYLRCGRPVPAIDVCTKILKDYPHYPRIRREVLLRAWGMVRS